MLEANRERNGDNWLSEVYSEKTWYIVYLGPSSIHPDSLVRFCLCINHFLIFLLTYLLITCASLNLQNGLSVYL